MGADSSTGSSTGHIVDLVVQCDAGAGNAGRVALAASLAQRHGAQLAGLHVIDLLAATAMSAAAAGDAAGVGILMERMRADALEAAVGVEAAFRAAAGREGVAGEWRLVEDAAPATVRLHARHADLVVLGQTEPDGPAGQDAIIEHVLFGSGGPVLMVPAKGSFKTPGRRVLVAWNASREAVRAARDALPLLGGAELVRLVAVDPEPSEDGTGPSPAADFARHLARHGLPVDVAAVPSAGADAADVLLRAANEMGADLLVMGGYGRGPLREMILGGVTSSILHHMTLPVLMAH